MKKKRKEENFSTSQVASLIGVPVKKVYYWLRKGYLKASAKNKKNRLIFKRKQLQDFVIFHNLLNFGINLRKAEYFVETKKKDSPYTFSFKDKNDIVLLLVFSDTVDKNIRNFLTKEEN